MPFTLSEQPATSLTKSGQPRKQKRTGPDGKPMKRFTVIVSSEDAGRITTAITTRLGPVYAKAYDDDKILADGDPQEYLGRALAAICANWLDHLESDEI